LYFLNNFVHYRNIIHKNYSDLVFLLVVFFSVLLAVAVLAAGFFAGAFFSTFSAAAYVSFLATDFAGAFFSIFSATGFVSFLATDFAGFAIFSSAVFEKKSISTNSTFLVQSPFQRIFT